ncbi:MAG TPA: hypothetical protein VFN53_01145 [Acidobacteriaceae bacterium]|nr:hypothetical protein [Acidobacteriaceae bacterium]
MTKSRGRICIGVSIALALVVSGCKHRAAPPPKPMPAPAQAKPVKVKQAPPTPIEVKRVELGGPSWNPGWDTFIERSLPRSMLSHRVPRDVRRFCPCFFTMSNTNKRAFWAYFFQALAGAEAGLNAKTNVLHTEVNMGIDRVSRQRIRSEGLLQLTYEDKTRYGCNFDWEADRHLPLHDPRKTILNPENNLGCGIRILKRQIITERKPLFSPSSYWATLRPESFSYEVFARQMINPPRACGFHLPRRKPIERHYSQVKTPPAPVVEAASSTR